MTTQSAQQPAALELALIDVVRTLPSRRVLQVLDFAYWLQTQLASDEEADETLEKVITDGMLMNGETHAASTKHTISAALA